MAAAAAAHADGSTRARAWAAKDPDPATAAALRTALAANDTAALALGGFGDGDAALGRISFGTAGLRAAMGFGPARMNRLVIIETTAGLAAHLLKTSADARTQGVVIAYDGRHGSREFAETAAGVLIAAGIKAYLFSERTPTPIGAYATRTLGAAAGIVVTASHNPPQDNGYKVYWHGGAQINSPLDAQIAAAIDEVAALPALPKIHPVSIDTPEKDASSLLQLLDRSVFEAYAKETLATFPPPTPSPTDSSEPQARAALKIAYTPMHGVGAIFAEQLLERSGFSAAATVKEQREPDGDFPTVQFPNPEEPGAMDRVIALADSTDAAIAIANDPDADRLSACARLDDAAHTMKQLTGDQVGALLGDELMRRYVAGGGKGAGGPAGWVLTTIVSSRLLARLARLHGVQIRECLTGFKWLGAVARTIETGNAEKGGHGRFLFAYEEALGYMVQPHVWDKDGLSALVLLASLAAELHAARQTLWHRLEAIHRAAGLSVTIQRTIKLQGGRSGSSFMRELRAELKKQQQRKAGSTTAAAAAALPFRFALVDDLLERPAASGGDEDLERIVREGIIPRNDVLRFYFEDGTLSSSGGGQGQGSSREEIELGAPRIIVRPSGTEPKVKIYCEALGEVGQGESYTAAESRVRADLESLVDAFYKWVIAL